MSLGAVRQGPMWTPPHLGAPRHEKHVLGGARDRGETNVGRRPQQSVLTSLVAATDKDIDAAAGREGDSQQQDAARDQKPNDTQERNVAGTAA